jgi:hypothetical protein
VPQGQARDAGPSAGPDLAGTPKQIAKHRLAARPLIPPFSPTEVGFTRLRHFNFGALKVIEIGNSRFGFGGEEASRGKWKA